MANSHNTNKAGDILSKWFDNNEIKMMSKYSSFFRRWNSIVGDNLGSHSKVIDINNNVLIIEVDHPGWLQKIQFFQKDILKNIKRLYPELGITTLSYRIKSDSNQIKEEIKIVKKEKTKLNKPENIRSLEDIKNEELRNILKRIENHVFSNDNDSKS